MGARWIPSAAIVPMIVDTIAVARPTIMLLIRLRWISLLARTNSYQCRLNPVQFVTRVLALKLKMTTTRIGRYRNP